MPEESAAVKGTCFVVMGFGKKPDFETGRTLDLDKTYKNIIQPAVIAAGLNCVRADEIVHSGLIDVPMYQQLLEADVVVADLSTSNKNAFYELGVRHGLRPSTTIVICEDGLKTPPFDVNHIIIRSYHHLGEDIGFSEVERFRKVLTDAIVEVYNKEPRPHDSPVYTFLNNLTPPRRAEVLRAMADSVGAPVVDTPSAQTHSEMMQDAEDAQKSGDFETAKSLYQLMRKKRKKANPNQSEDPYIVQRLALVTYKEKQPTPEAEIAALREACDLLYTLDPGTSNDTETLGIWGAVHKRLWDKTRDVVALDKAIRSYGRGFFIRNDYYNGINLAFLLNVRSAYAVDPTNTSGGGDVERRAAAIADFVEAARIREEVLQICDAYVAENPAPGEGASDDAKQEYLKNKYWVVASKAEAYLGMGNTAAAETTYQEAYSFAAADWMITSTKEQRAKLEALLASTPLKYVKAE